ncbi:MAG: N-acetyltransferase [Saprospiraceae bacterium]|nr:N-acetyltransferase [Saprospiraceae bacterium]
MEAQTNWEEIPLLDNRDKKQFELRTDKHLIRIEYILAGPRMFLTHTEVPRELEGQGLGSIIIRRVLDEIRERKLKLVPLCPFVAAFLQKNEAYLDLLAEGYHV